MIFPLLTTRFLSFLIVGKKRKIYIKSEPEFALRKMRNRQFAILAVLLILVFSFGCGSIGGNGGTTVQGESFHTGTSAIKLKFMPNSPPSVMDDGQTYFFSLEITNIGAYTTSPHIFLTGHDTNIIRLSSWNNRIVGPINGKDENYPQGGYSLIEDQVPIVLPPESESYPTTLKLTACYPYSTEANIPICVDPDPTNNRDDACISKSVSTSGGQGGPIAVTMVVPNSNRGQASFSIKIQNLGDGDVILPGKVDSCLSRLSPMEMDVVQITGARLGTNQLVCTPTTIRLSNKVGTTTCKGAISAASSFTSNLILDMDYGYKNSILTPVSVRRV